MSISKISKFGRNILTKIKELSIPQSKKAARDLLIRERKRITSADFKPGNLIFTRYNAKDKTRVFDKTPLALVLRRNSHHTLVLNFHWLPMNMRINLVKVIIKMNAQNIKNNKRLEFDYRQLKPLLKRYGYAPVIRLYINSRIGSLGVVIPPERLLEVAKLKTETFTGGVSANKMYANAKKYK